MSQMNPFRPTGQTQVMTLTTAAQSLQLSTGPGGTCTAVRCLASLTSGVLAFVAIGSSGVTAAAPTTATASTGTPMLWNTRDVFEIVGSQNWVSVISSSAGTFYLTPGTGMGTF